MANVIDLKWNDPTTKTYATRENAVKAIEKLVVQHKEQFYMTVTTNDQGRYVPVVLLTEAQMYLMGGFAHKGIPVVRV